MIPVLEGNKPKIMLTTGAVTMKNYTDAKAGKVGEFHHTFGFAIVEIKDDETFFVRQVTAEDKSGAFTDLIYRVEDGGVSQISSISAAVLGDLHYGHHDQEVLDKTLKFLDNINRIKFLMEVKEVKEVEETELDEEEMTEDEVNEEGEETSNNETETTTTTGGAGTPGVWASGLTRGKGNPIGNTKWESGITRSKGNPLK
jgi:hypothetical protein